MNWLLMAGFVPNAIPIPDSSYYKETTTSPQNWSQRLPVEQIEPPIVSFIHQSGACLVRVRIRSFEWVSSSLDNAVIHRTEINALFNDFYQHWIDLGGHAFVD